MPATVVVRGGGGSIHTMDIPTAPRAREKFMRRFERGELELLEGTLDATDSESTDQVSSTPVQGEAVEPHPGTVEAILAGDSVDIDSLSKAELVAAAAEAGVEGASSMTKAQLVAALSGPVEPVAG